jgi:hypothetical protein
MAIDAQARSVFDNLIRIFLGNGKRVLFWRDCWINDFTASEVAPTLGCKVGTRVCNARTMEQGLVDNRWILDLGGPLSDDESQECELWLAL